MSDMIYKINGPHRGPEGTTYEYKDAVKGKTPDGWHTTLSGAVDAHLRPRKSKPAIAKD